MTTQQTWYGTYEAAVLETDWTKMPDRIKATEGALHERQRVLSQDHGGTPEERQAIDDAFRSLRVLRQEVAEWQMSQNIPASKKPCPEGQGSSI